MPKKQSRTSKFHIYLRKVRLITQGCRNYLAFKLLNKNKFNCAQTITIFGSIRSGSTWLAELICSVEGNIQIFEPLHPDYIPEIKRNFSSRQLYIEPNKNWKAGKHIFNNILSGKSFHPWVLSQNSFSQASSGSRLVVKFVRGNLLLDWFTRNFNGIPPILILRHPCAVVASHLNKGWLPSKNTLLNHDYLQIHQEIKQKCQSLNTKEELAALFWCLVYHAPLSSPKPYKFHLVTYENLVKNGKIEMTKIFEICQLPLKSDILNKLSKPSDTTVANSTILKGNNLLSGWRTKLTIEQTERIFKVLKIFNIEFYNHEIEPDYKLLSEFKG